MDKEESIDGGPSAESYARLAQAQAMSRNITLDQLRLERDVSVTAGITPSVRQQTIVGNISGAGNRHVIEDQAPLVRRLNIPSNTFEGESSITVTDGTTTVTGVRTINFDGNLFTVSSSIAGQANVTLKTTEC